MSRELYEKILEASKRVDKRFASISHEELMSFEESFVIPAPHPRSASLTKYFYRVGLVEQAFSDKSTLVLVDKALESQAWLKEALPSSAKVFWILPNEKETKEQHWLDTFMKKEVKVHVVKHVVAIGGGIITNASAYIAERLQCDLVYVPTTVLAMSDGSIGGKVRANFVENGVYHKHRYKAFYEPNVVIIDPRFLESLPDRQVSVGMGEIIKHGVYQSLPLLEYLGSDAFNPFADNAALLKVILWAAALKSICLNVDPEESKDGSRIIMRGAHEASDKIEEASQFTIPHGIAVTMAMHEELRSQHSPLLPLFEKCLEKFFLK